MAVCEELARRTPGDHDKRSALLNSGAEAVENAVKIARHATGRPAIVAFDHAYHGRTNLTMALTAKNMPYKDKFGPFAGEIYRMPMAYPLRWPGGPEACAANALERDHRADPHPGGRGQRGRGPDRADPGRGRLHRAAGRLPARAGRVLPGARHPAHRRRDPDRVLPDRRLVRLRSRGRRARPGHHGQGDRGRAAAGRGHRAGRDHGLGATWAASAAPTAGTRWPARPRSGPSRPWRPRTCRAGPGGSARSCCPGCTSWPRPTRSSATCAAAGR